jgi:hypothetical protein
MNNRRGGYGRIRDGNSWSIDEFGMCSHDYVVNMGVTATYVVIIPVLWNGHSRNEVVGIP